MLRNLYLVFANWLLVLNTLLNTQSLGVALHVQKLLMTRSRVFRIQAGTYIWIISILIHKICPISKFCGLNFEQNFLVQCLWDIITNHRTSGSIYICMLVASNKQWWLCCMRSSVQTRGTRHETWRWLPLQHFLPVCACTGWSDSHWLYWADQNIETVLVVVLNQPRFPPKSANVIDGAFV